VFVSIGHVCTCDIVFNYTIKYHRRDSFYFCLAVFVPRYKPLRLTINVILLESKKQDIKLLFLSSPNIGGFSKIFHRHILYRIFTKAIVKNPTTRVSSWCVRTLSVQVCVTVCHESVFVVHVLACRVHVP